MLDKNECIIKFKISKYIFNVIYLFIYLFIFVLSSVSFAKNTEFRLVIHGGAGDITEKNIPSVLKKEHEAKLNEALQAGYAILSKGGDRGFSSL